MENQSQDDAPPKSVGSNDSNLIINKWRQMLLSVHHPLVPLKLAMLLYDGGWALYLPYLTLEMVRTGLTIKEVSIVYAALPFVTSIMPVLAGMMADKFKVYKILLATLVTLAALFHTVLLFVNVNNDSLPTTKIFAEFSCKQTDLFIQFDHSNCDDIPIGNEWPAQNSLCIAHLLCAQEKDNCTDPYSNVAFIVEDISVAQMSNQCIIKVLSINFNDSTSTLNCEKPIKCDVEFHKDSGNVTLTHDESRQAGFWIYFIVRICATSCLCAASSELGTTAIRMAKKHKGDLGKQRIFGVVGQAFFGMMGGVLLDWTIKWKGYADYSFLLYLADGILVLVVLLISRFDVGESEMASSASSAKKNTLKAGFNRLIRLVDIDIFVFAILLLGACWGFMESFLFVFLTELESDNSGYLFGLTLTLGCIIGLPFLYVSDKIIDKIGSANVIAISLVVYSIRFFGCSFITNPWLCLPFEAMKSITIYLMAVAGSNYCAAAAPTGLLATLNGVVNSVYASFGRGLGTVIGGILISTYGSRVAFRIFGTISGVCGIAYLILHRVYLGKLEKIRLRRKSEYVSEVMANGGQIEDEEEEAASPPEFASRRMSCY